MAKILLVEDDNNLREIYEARLQAEGYDIVSARDGEEALTVAMKEHPDLIISDVMMPKISGFDMLDIIRSTEETKNAKVIMMTALSQAEDKERAAKLGADRYLVKSQVTLEDVAKVAREVLEGGATSTSQESPVADEPQAVADTQAAPVAITPSAAVPASPPDEVTTTIAPTTAISALDSPSSDTDSSPMQDPASTALAAISPAPASDDTATTDALPHSVEDEQSAIAAQIESFIDANTSVETVQQGAEKVQVPSPSNDELAATQAEPTAVAVSMAAPPSGENPEEKDGGPIVAENTEPNPASEEDLVSSNVGQSVAKKVIQPISDPTVSKGPDLNILLQKEEDKEKMAEIAKSILDEKNNAADNMGAEFSSSNTTPSSETAIYAEADIDVDTPQLTISENGDLQIGSVAESTMPDLVETAVVTTDVPQIENVPQKPIIPHSNGSNIDGIVPQPTAQTMATTPSDSPPNTTSQTDTAVDHNSIAI
jgi:CheY-like chemotaxis protein